MRHKAILCIDDEVIVLESIVEQLERRLGDAFIYETAESADEGFEVIEELFDDNIEILVIVSDWLMPGMKGDEFLIRIHQRFPGIVKVLLTGQADSQAIRRAEKYAGLHACIHKPWSEEELIQIIETGLEQL